MKFDLKRIKICFVFLSIILFALSGVYASAFGNSSSVIPLDSDFYQDFDSLMNALGKQSDKTRPYSIYEAEKYLNQIEEESLSAAEKKVFLVLKDMIDDEGIDSENYSFDFDLKLQPQLYIHTNTDFKDRVDFLNDGSENVEYGYDNSDKFMTWDREKPHFIDMDFYLSFNERVSLLFRLPITNTIHTGSPSGSRYFMTNFPFLADFTNMNSKNVQDFCMNFPYRANISIADDWYSLLLGRERFEFGAGESGNFLIDGSLPYHNALSASLFTQNFKYNFFVSFFPHPSQYIKADDEGIISTSLDGSEYISDLIFNQSDDAFTGLKMFMSHRFDVITSNRKTRIAVTEAIMYQSDKGVLDLQILNPMMFFHNLYIAGNSNSMLQFEFDTFLARGVNLHLALAIDDFNIPFEGEDGSEQRPNAVALQLGVRTSHFVGKGIIEANAEITYMSPYFYLRDGKSETSYPLDFVVAIRNQRSGAGIYDLYTIGYPNGGDQGIALMNISYRVPYGYKAELGFEYRLFGRNNLMTVYMHGDTVRPLAHQFKISAGGEYYFNKSMKFAVEIYDSFFLNYNNEKNRNENDFFITFAFSYEI